MKRAIFGFLLLFVTVPDSYGQGTSFVPFEDLVQTLRDLPPPSQEEILLC